MKKKNGRIFVQFLGIVVFAFWGLHCAKELPTFYSYVPQIPELNSPADRALNVSLRPTFTWKSATGASNYTLEISQDSMFTGGAITKENLASTISQVIGLKDTTMYYWRVSATNAGGTSNYSKIFSFTTALADSLYQE